MKNDFQLVILGSSGVGKSAITIQLIQNHFIEEYDPTIEDSYRKQLLFNGEHCTLDILDTADIEEYTHSQLRENYMTRAEGFLIVFALNNTASFDNVAKYWEQIKQIRKSEKIPITLVGNKCDLNDWTVSIEDAKKLANEMEMSFIQTSAKTREGIEEAFCNIVEEIKKTRKDKQQGCCDLSRCSGKNSYQKMGRSGH